MKDFIKDVAALIGVKILVTISLLTLPIGYLIGKIYGHILVYKTKQNTIVSGSFNEYFIDRAVNVIKTHTFWQDIICRLRIIFIDWTSDSLEKDFKYITMVE